METDYSQIMLKEKLEFLDILREALKIPLQHINFIIFSLFTSFPYFSLSVFFEVVLQKTLLVTLEFFAWSFHHSYFDWESSVSFKEWVKLCLLYLVPCHLLGLLNIVLNFNAASMIYSEGKPIGFRDMMVQKPRLKGPLITSIYALLLSTCILLGFVGVVTNYYVLSKGLLVDYYLYGPKDFYMLLLITVFHIAVFMALLIKFSEWSAGWNMALVTSILEETSGIEAFELSAYFSRGSTQRGLLLMLVFSVWEIICRLPCFFGKCNGGIDVFTFACTSLICVGNFMKWVVCVVYFFDCKKRILEKKVDEEVGRDVKVVN